MWERKFKCPIRLPSQSYRIDRNHEITRHAIFRIFAINDFNQKWGTVIAKEELCFIPISQVVILSNKQHLRQKIEISGV